MVCHGDVSADTRRGNGVTECVMGTYPLTHLRVFQSPEEVLADAVFYYSRSGGFRKILPMEAILE